MLHIDTVEKHKQFVAWRHKFIPTSYHNLTIGSRGYEEGIDINIENDNTDIVGTVCNLPIKDNCFDNALLFQVFEHTTYPGKALKELSRVITNSIYISINVVRRTKVNDLTIRDNKKEHKFEFSPRDFKTLLWGCGLKIVRKKRLNSFWYSSVLPFDNFFGVHRCYDIYEIKKGIK
jgi:hypothetical protein